VTLRAVIVDDEPLARRRLRALVADVPGLEIVGEAGDGPAAIAVVETARPDLVFLDVQMPGADGFEVLDAVTRSLGRAAPAVIFVTAFDQFALRAFDAHAVDYLLKPFDRRRLGAALERAHARVGGRRALEALLRHVAAERPLGRLSVREGDRVRFLRVAEIDWLSSAGHYVAVRAAGREHLVRDTIGRLAARLPAARFVRVHRGTIVNLDCVAELRTLVHGDVEVLLRDGTRLRGSRTYAARLRDAMGSGVTTRR